MDMSLNSSGRKFCLKLRAAPHTVTQSVEEILRKYVPISSEGFVRIIHIIDDVETCTYPNHILMGCILSRLRDGHSIKFCEKACG